MVFELTDGLARCPQKDWRILTICISNLLIGYYEGYLSLIASKPLCRFLKDKDLAVGIRESIALNHLANNNSYTPSVLWHIRVVLDSPDVSKHELDISFFSSVESVLPSSFLCEHLIDIRFYMRIAYSYYPNSPMKVFERCGGGGSTADVFKNIKRKNIVCLVILDSDCKYPGCARPPKGTTAFRCISSYSKPLSNVEIVVLPVHEIENLVPLSFMLQKTDANGLKFLARLKKHNMVDKLIFYDIKQGITKKNAMDSPDLLSFAQEIYDGIYPQKQSFDSYFKHKKPQDYLHPAINPNMLSDFMEDKQKNYEPDMFDAYRKSIADIVHTFFCCRGDTPIN